jgi:hypothetical protein
MSVACSGRSPSELLWKTVSETLAIATEAAENGGGGEGAGKGSANRDQPKHVCRRGW